ncbi:MAG: hypothetical protein DSY90_06475 [Deltaproteobacteria bacterium]|nr:MAG: hypothetical protein DSY90_06475 [Deltaproteobacteria bacterium]
MRANYIGFFRYGQEGLNVKIGMERNRETSPLFPSGVSFNATCIRLSLGRLLPGRACLRFTGSGGSYEFCQILSIADQPVA